MPLDPDEPNSKQKEEGQRALREALDKVPPFDPVKLQKKLDELLEEERNRTPQGGYIPRCGCGRHWRYRAA